MSFTLPPLPYPKNALAPHISEETITFHYEKHHGGYVTKLNQLTEGTSLAGKSLDDIVKSEKGKVFNMAAQVRTFQRCTSWRKAKTAFCVARLTRGTLFSFPHDDLALSFSNMLSDDFLGLESQFLLELDVPQRRRRSHW